VTVSRTTAHCLGLPRGKVLESRLREVQDSEGKTWAVYILYEYAPTAIAAFRVWRLEAGSSSFTGQMEKVIARYPAGSTVTVYYIPMLRTMRCSNPGKMSWWHYFWRDLLCHRWHCRLGPQPLATDVQSNQARAFHDLL